MTATMMTMESKALAAAATEVRRQRGDSGKVWQRRRQLGKSAALVAAASLAAEVAAWQDHGIGGDGSVAAEAASLAAEAAAWQEHGVGGGSQLGSGGSSLARA